MNCCYPNCRALAIWTPVVEVPTLRSVGEGQAMVETTRPTLLICREVCDTHKDSYNLADWISLHDWQAMQEAAEANGYFIPNVGTIGVSFRPVDWHPLHGYMEIER